MYSLVRRFIKTGIGFLAAGLAVGFWMLVERELMGTWPHPYLRSAHVHAVSFGFVVFVILGVALWLFPRAARDDTRYRPERIAAAYWILTIGTALRFGAELARARFEFAGSSGVIVVAGAAQVLGIWLYFHTMWSRIRPVGSHLREARGERF